jgi:hypothetical protein
MQLEIIGDYVEPVAVVEPVVKPVDEPVDHPVHV